jgi:DnaK suppressor protein
MDVQLYKKRLLDLEATLAAHAQQQAGQARDQTDDSAGDVGDESVVDEAESEDFSAAELDATILRQVRDALHRIEDGTYGRCLVDGEPIETKRLNAVPWAAYCIKHQRLLEAATKPAPTL